MMHTRVLARLVYCDEVNDDDARARAQREMASSHYSGVLKQAGNGKVGGADAQVVKAAASEPAREIWQGVAQVGSGFLGHVGWARKRLGVIPFWALATFGSVACLLSLIDPPFVRKHVSYDGIYVPGQSWLALACYAGVCALLVAGALWSMPMIVAA
jgi:hypothetical protein